MRRMRNLFSMMFMLLCLLATVSAWAMPPEDGIYEMKDVNGKVTARMFIITLRGKASETQEGCGKTFRRWSPFTFDWNGWLR